jgi:hypothetical protein
MTADAHEAAVARLRDAYAAWPPGTPVRLAKRTSNLFRFRDSDRPLRPARPRPPRPRPPPWEPRRPGRFRVRPRAERRSRRQDREGRRHDHLRGPVRRDAQARADAAGGAAAQDDHPRRRRHRAGHRVHLAAQRHAARVGDRDGDPDRRRPRGPGHRGQRARRPVPRLPELLRDPGLQPLAHDRTRAGAAFRAPAPLPVRHGGSLHGRGRPDRRGGKLSAATGRISSTAPRSGPTSFTSPSGRSATSRPGAAITPASRSTTNRSGATRRTFLTIRDYLWRWDTDWFWCSRPFGVQKPLIRRLWPRRYRRSDVYRKLVAFDRRHGLSDALNSGRGTPAPRGCHPGRGDPGRARRRVPAILCRKCGDEPGLDVPAAAAR